jgi:hypothetical protein
VAAEAEGSAIMITFSLDQPLIYVVLAADTVRGIPALSSGEPVIAFTSYDDAIAWAKMKEKIEGRRNYVVESVRLSGGSDSRQRTALSRPPSASGA